MPGPFDFTDTNIQDTYQRVVQTDGTNFYDGTGSAVSIGQTDISALNAHTGSINAATSSFVLNSQTGSFAVTGSDVIFNHITASGDISASGTATFNALVAAGLSYPTTDGDANQIIITDGAGNLTFANNSSEATHIECKNTSGGTLTKGTPVYITGTVGSSTRLEVAAADASDPAKMPAAGVLESDLANNAEGFVAQGGYLRQLSTATIDGTSTNSNDTIYVKGGGGLTMTKPTGSALIQNIAKVARSHASAGSIIVSSILRTNDVPNLLQGQIFFGSGSNQMQQLHISGALDATVINNITASGDISASGIISASNITATGNINANRFKGDARDLTNVPNDLVWDGDVNDGYLTIVTCTRFAESGEVNEQQSIPTSSLEWTDPNFAASIISPVIYTRQPDSPELIFNYSLASVEYIVFSGSNFGMDSTLEAASPRLIKIDLNALDGDNDGEVEDVYLLGAIRDALIERRNNSFNQPEVGYNIQDSYLVKESTSQEPHQFAFSNFYAAEPANTEIFDFHYFISESNRRGGGNETTQIFNVTTNPNKVYSSLVTDLDTTFSSSVEITGSLTLSNNTDLDVGGTFTATTITASGIISSSAAVTASGLLLPQLGSIEWTSNAQERQTIKGTDNYIQIDGDNRVLINADNDVTITTPRVDLSSNLNVANNITASIVSASNGLIGDLTGNADTATTASYVETAVTGSVSNQAQILTTVASTNYQLVFVSAGSKYQTLRRDSDSGLTFNPDTDKLTVAGDVSVGGALGVSGNFALSTAGSSVFTGGLFNHTAFGKANFAGDSLEFGQHSSGNNANITQGYVYAFYNGLWHEYTPTGSADLDKRKGILGVATTAGRARFMIRGQMRTTAQNFTGMTSGDILYGAQNIPGRLTNVAVSGSGDIVRPVGYVLTPGTGEFWFDPDKTWVQT